MLGVLLLEGGLNVGLMAVLKSTLLMAVLFASVGLTLCSCEVFTIFDLSGVSGELIDIDLLLPGLTVSCLASLKIWKVSFALLSGLRAEG
jgi:hypothetical protein